MNVFEQADKAVNQWDAQRSKQVVPVGLHVLRCSTLGHVLTAQVLIVGHHQVGDEIVVPTGGLKKAKTNSKFVH